MMDFITHCWKKAWPEPERLTRWVLVAWLLGMSSAWAQVSSVELTEMRFERRDTGYYLSTQLTLSLGPAVEDALLKGLAVYFVAEAEIMRDRWYWYDRKVGLEARHYRLAFQPLTRRWRVNVSSEPISTARLAGSISQNFETLAEALDVIRRQSGWQIAKLTDLDPEARQYITYRFKLDINQLPRPFQIAAGDQAEWTLMVDRRIRLSQDLVH